MQGGGRGGATGTHPASRLSRGQGARELGAEAVGAQAGAALPAVAAPQLLPALRLRRSKRKKGFAERLESTRRRGRASGLDPGRRLEAGRRFEGCLRARARRADDTRDRSFGRAGASLCGASPLDQGEAGRGVLSLVGVIDMMVGLQRSNNLLIQPPFFQPRHVFRLSNEPYLHVRRRHQQTGFRTIVQKFAKHVQADELPTHSSEIQLDLPILP